MDFVCRVILIDFIFSLLLGPDPQSRKSVEEHGVLVERQGR